MQLSKKEQRLCSLTHRDVELIRSLLISVEDTVTDIITSHYKWCMDRSDDFINDSNQQKNQRINSLPQRHKDSM